MAAPANNPFGAAPQQAFNTNPFGAPASGQLAAAFGAPAQNPFGAPAAKPNPFGSHVANPFGAPTNNPFGAPATGSRPSSAGNPFGVPSGNTSLFGSPAGSPAPSRGASPAVAHNPFGKPPTQPQAQAKNVFGAAQNAARQGRSPSPFGSRAPPTGPSKPSGFSGPADANAMGRRGKLVAGKPAAPANNGGFGARGGHSQGPQRATPFAAKAFAKQPNGQVATPSTKVQPGGRNKQPNRYQAPPGGQGRNARTSGPSERTKQLSNFAFNYANRLADQLKKDNITPPQWPADPGNPDKRAAIESLKDAYKKYRTRVYASLRKADLIDDPEKRRKLEDALPFKGICEDMCPEFEQCYRIAEYDVKMEEKETRPDGVTMWPDVSRMVKKFGRSAAGQDAPLPMDVRSVDALRRTTDYLFNDLLQSEDNLPVMHNFLWDRTRAVRKDFTFHSQKSAEEMKDMVYCFETITRFHATALHLLSRKGFANEDFDQRQEIEQLGRTILSLIEAYDVCRDKRVHCENEPEFRAYYLLLNAHDPSIAKRIPTWGKEYWFESEEVQTALSLIQAMDDVREPKGPIKPRRPTTLSDTSLTNYFSIVEDPRVSYTMACIAEIHFTTVRQGILKNLVRAYARHRDAPRTITASDLNAMLRFDTPEEAAEFAELHDFELSMWVPEGKNPVTEPYLLLNNKKKHVPSPRVRQAFSGKVVERKRTTESLPHVIYNTIFEEPTERPSSSASSPDSLFVTQAKESRDLAMGGPTFGQPVKPIPPPAAQSPFGFPTNKPPGGIQPGGGMLAGTPTPAFGGFPVSQPPPAPATSPFTALGQPPAQAGKSPFSFLNQPQVPSTAETAPKPASILGQLAQTEQPTTSPLAGVKPPEPSNPFASFKGFNTAATPAPQATQPSTAVPSAPTTTPTISSTPTPVAPSAPTKPAETPASSLLGSAPPAGAPLFPAISTAAPTQQAGAAAPAVPSIFVSPPSVISKPAAQSQPALSASSVQPVGQPPLPASTWQSPAPVVAQPPPKRDLLGDVTKWYVKGDGGLLQDFTEEVLRNMLWNVWNRFEREEAKRKQREEDEESWRVAREHQTYRLRVKYFYRWRNTARSLATKRILREGKEKMRQYREQQKAAQRQQQEEKEKAEQEARRAAKRQLAEDSHHLSLLASSTRRRGSVAFSADHNPEEQLLASGIFSHLRDDPRAVARRVVREAAAHAVNGSTEASRSFRYPESELELEPARGTSPDASSVGGRREGWKTRSLREKFGIEPRRSLSASGSVVNGGSFVSSSSRFRQSLPNDHAGSSNKTTNFSAFSRKRSADEESNDGNRYTSNPTSTSLPKSRHWDLRARGFVPTPDGNWLPEALARSTSHHLDNSHNNNRLYSPSPDAASDIVLHDAGVSRAASPTPLDLRLRLARLKKPRPHQHRGHRSVDLSGGMGGFGGVLDGSPPHPEFNETRQGLMLPPVWKGKRKRDSEEQEMESVEGEGEEEESPTGRKRVNVDGGGGGGYGNGGGGNHGSGGVLLGKEETRGMVENTKRMLRELREFVERAEREEREGVVC